MLTEIVDSVRVRWKLAPQDPSASGGSPLTAVFRTFIMGSSQQTSFTTSLANWHAYLQNQMI